jgi:hypothetical protein
VIHVADVIAVAAPLSVELRFAAYTGLDEPPSASSVILRFRLEYAVRGFTDTASSQ